MSLYNPRTIEYTVNNMRTKIYLTAPTIGHYSESIRHEIFDHVFDELESCGYEMTGYIFDSDKIIIIDMPGWEQCDRVADDIAAGTYNNICIELMELCEVM